jgi:soluble lytic murein transglycosylase
MAGQACSRPDKEGAAIKSSMHKRVGRSESSPGAAPRRFAVASKWTISSVEWPRHGGATPSAALSALVPSRPRPVRVWALTLGLLGISAGAVAAVAAGVTPSHIIRALPVAMQSAAQPVFAPPPPPPAAPAYSVSPSLGAGLASWTALRQSDNLPFSSYSYFLLAHRGWPGEAAMRKTAEKADTSGASPSDVIAFFRAFPPLTNNGHARLALALLAGGQSDEARAEARAAWQGGVLGQADEQLILGTFGGALSQDDHDRRMEALLAGGDTQSALRTLPLASAARRPLFETRLALRARAADAADRLAALGPGYEADAGLLADRANWLRNTNQFAAARQSLASRPALAAPPANAETWYETLLTMARGAATDNQWTIAWQIASRLDDAYPPGTDVSARPYGERDDYTSLAWIAGTTALNRLGRPADAVGMFERYARAARSPQTRSKGYYWAARAAYAAGQPQQSNAYLEQAAAVPDQFYGQLALERLGRRVEAPPMAPVQPDPVQRAAFASRPLVEATRLLGQTGQYGDQTLFVRALAQQAETDSERALTADFGRQIGRADLGVWVAREARNKGATFYARSGFPEVPLAPAYARHWTLAHAITRQESSFDRAAISNAGARGMMQLMPGTAREVAGKIGLPYAIGSLTADPSYNMMLGTSYLSTLLDQWGGNATLAVASYNAGTGNVRRWIQDNGDPRSPGADVVRWIEAIPFSETRNYVQRVLENAVVYDAIYPQRGYGPDRNRLSFYLGKTNPG